MYKKLREPYAAVNFVDQNNLIVGNMIWLNVHQAKMGGSIKSGGGVSQG